MKEPGPDHPITIRRNPGRVRVTLAGTVIADTAAALTLTEAGHDPVHYVPRADVRQDLFARSARVTRCPYKGEASHFDLILRGALHPAAAWSYEEPHPALAPIKDHLAFYPDAVDAIAELPA